MPAGLSAPAQSDPRRGGVRRLGHGRERLLSLSRAAACHHRDDGGYAERSHHHVV